MKSPMTGKELIPMREPRKLTFRKEEFEIIYHFLREPDGSDQYTTTELDEINISQIYNQYREKYKLPFPDEIKAIRTKYDLSAAKMSDVLGFGANVWRNYEAGEVPSESNARLIQVADDEVEFAKLVKLSAHLDDKAKAKILDRIEVLRKANDGWRTVFGREDFLMGNKAGADLPDKYTGYRKPSLERTLELIKFFTAQLAPHLYKTRLNKLLFYADFRHFQLHGVSITGGRYRAIQMGPVPVQYASLYEYAQREGKIKLNEQELNEGGIMGQFLPMTTAPFNAELFEESELAVLNEVCEQFRNTKAKEIEHISHEEEAWKQHEKEHTVIDYTLAFGLKAFDKD
ncbi:MAG: DUF4065 domain-containing protein [Flavobacteriales bacterium]|nr:DUF4065 domain-containing protein [Flavobacteriales bacterium]